MNTVPIVIPNQSIYFVIPSRRINSYLVLVRELCTHNAFFPPLFFVWFLYGSRYPGFVCAMCTYPFLDAMIRLFHALYLI
jgi:hypothetical protein